jgi:type I restriction enzyme S subunit
LRFPEFTEPWETAKLGVIAEFSKGTGISKEQRSETGLPCILYGELYTTYTNEVIEDVVSKIDLDPTDLVKSQKNDVIIPSSGETAEDIATARCVTSDNVLLGGDLNIIRLVEPNDGRFMSYQLNGIRKYDIAKIAQGVSVVHLYGGDLKMLSVTFPQSPEQKKIADCISLLDRRISVQIGLIEKLESLISGITLSVVKSDDCESIQLTEILTERNEVNTAQYEVYSVSVSQGVVNQVEYLGRSFAAKDTSNYNVVHYGDIVYTKSPTGDFPYGIVKRSNQAKPVAVSPLYGVYIPASNDIGCFLHYYFCNAVSTKNYLHKLIQKGAKNTINITNQRFLENTIKLPNAEKLAILVKLLNKLSMKKQRAEELLALYRKQKHYLLSQMFI